MMKTFKWLILAGILLCVNPDTGGAQGTGGETGEALQAASELLLDSTANNCTKGLTELVKIMTRASAAGFPDGFHLRLSRVAGLMTDGELPGPEACRLLHEAWQLTNDGHEFRMPDGLSTIEQIRSYIREEIQSAGRLLQTGQKGPGTFKLLGVVLMVITPVERDRPGSG